MGSGEDERKMITSPFGGTLFQKQKDNGDMVFYDRDPVQYDDANVVPTQTLSNGNIYVPIETSN